MVRSEVNIGCLPSITPYCFESGHFIQLGAPYSSRLASQKGPGGFLSLPPQCWDYPRGPLSPALLHGFWGETSGPMPMQQHFTK